MEGLLRLALVLPLLAASIGCLGTRGGRIPTVDISQISGSPSAATVGISVEVKKKGSDQDVLRNQMTEALRSAFQQAGATVLQDAEPGSATLVATRITVDGSQVAEAAMSIGLARSLVLDMQRDGVLPPPKAPTKAVSQTSLGGGKLAVSDPRAEGRPASY